MKEVHRHTFKCLHNFHSFPIFTWTFSFLRTTQSTGHSRIPQHLPAYQWLSQHFNDLFYRAAGSAGTSLRLFLTIPVPLQNIFTRLQFLLLLTQQLYQHKLESEYAIISKLVTKSTSCSVAAWCSSHHTTTILPDSATLEDSREALQPLQSLRQISDTPIAARTNVSLHPTLTVWVP